MVQMTGLEPVRYFYQWILSPLRLPIPPHLHILHSLFYVPSASTFLEIEMKHLFIFINSFRNIIKYGRLGVTPPNHCWELLIFKIEGFYIRDSLALAGNTALLSYAHQLYFYLSIITQLYIPSVKTRIYISIGLKP